MPVVPDPSFQKRTVTKAVPFNPTSRDARTEEPIRPIDRADLRLARLPSLRLVRLRKSR